MIELPKVKGELKLRRALLSVSDKTDIEKLAKALHLAGCEVVATGNTGKAIEAAGVPVRDIQDLTKMPEAFQGRMKTLSFQVCSGILYRRDDEKDLQDLKRLEIEPIDCVVVNFYPFEKSPSIETIDIGGPTLVRSAAKNAPYTLVLTDPSQYLHVIEQLERKKTISFSTAIKGAKEAWKHVVHYDKAIEEEMNEQRIDLRYGENPHQKSNLFIEDDSPILWPRSALDGLTANELSYNNILDATSAYHLACDLIELEAMAKRSMTGVVIVKHHNPCGVCLVESSVSQLDALKNAWAGDPVSSFGGVLVFTKPLEEETAQWLKNQFVELVLAPGLGEGSAMGVMLEKRKKLKAVAIERFEGSPCRTVNYVPGARLIQDVDRGLQEMETLQEVTQKKWNPDDRMLAAFGIAVTRSLKSNAISLVRHLPGAALGFQLVGAGQGQPNRVDALSRLAVPRAHAVLGTLDDGTKLSDCVMVSDAFFPFRDTVDEAARFGIKKIIQPGGSIKDDQSIEAANEHGIAMIFTGTRHFKH